MAERTLTIRAYDPKDRALVEDICAETGLRGHLSEHFCDRELFVKMWLSAYLNNGGKHPQVFNQVVEKDGTVVGYLVSWLGKGYERRVIGQNLPLVAKMLWRWATGKYRHHPPTGVFIRWMLLRMWREYPPKPVGMESHMHYNLREFARKEATGPRLQTRFARRVQEYGAIGWHGCLFIGPQRPVKIYERFGMTIGEKRRCTLFKDEEVWFTCLYQDLSKSVGTVYAGDEWE